MSAPMDDLLDQLESAREIIDAASRVELRAQVLIALARVGGRPDARLLGQAARDLEDQLTEARAVYLTAFPEARWPE